MERLTADAPLDWDAPLCDAMAVAGRTEAVLRRFGAGFGRQALPASFPADGSFMVRHAWARAQLIAAERRLAQRRGDAHAA